MKAVIYARYSTELQNDSSIEDQIELCRDMMESAGWQHLDTYADRALSGSTLRRPAYQSLLDDARRGRFDIVVAEGLDRLSRDQEDVAALFKRLRFAGVRLFTVAEGEISELHIGLKGTMNALFLKDLKLKIRRGLIGRIKQGKNIARPPYGYRLVRAFDARGQVIKGVLRIDEQEAAVVRRIFAEYIGGKSPMAIAKLLNREEVSGPCGRPWSDQVIRGQPSIMWGILRSELYIGWLVWNRATTVIDPESGRRVQRVNPKNQWVRHPVPELRIVDQSLWDRAHLQLDLAYYSARISKWRKGRFSVMQRPRHLLSGLIFCGYCGDRYVTTNGRYLCCRATTSADPSVHHMYSRREPLEALIFGAVAHQLESPTYVDQFVRAFRMALQDRRECEEAAASRCLTTFLEAPGKAGAGEGKVTLPSEVAAQEPSDTQLAEIYRGRVARLQHIVAASNIRAEAFSILRMLIHRIIVSPNPVDFSFNVAVGGALATLIGPGVGSEVRDGTNWFSTTLRRRRYRRAGRDKS